jgi:acyl carrier protein
VRGEWGSEAERELAALWGEALGVAEVGPDDNFFDLGGDSLSATRLVAIINDALQVDLRVNVAFEYPTVAQMAKLTEELRAERAAQEH